MYVLKIIYQWRSGSVKSQNTRAGWQEDKQILLQVDIQPDSKLFESGGANNMNMHCF